MDIWLFANDEEQRKHEAWLEPISQRIAHFNAPEFRAQQQKDFTQEIVRQVTQYIYHLDNAQDILNATIEALRSIDCNEIMRQREAQKNTPTICFRCGTEAPLQLMVRPMNLYQHPAQQQYHCAGCIELLKEEYFYTCVVCLGRYSPHFNGHAYFCPSCRTDERARESTRVLEHIERAKSLNVPASLTIKQWLATLDFFEWQCAYCPAPFKGLEHYIPIYLGGGTTVDNCLPSCKRCNSRKGDKHPDDFAHLFEVSRIMRIQAYLESVRLL